MTRLEVLIVLVVVGWLIVAVFVWALLAIAARGDRNDAQRLREPDEQEAPRRARPRSLRGRRRR